MTGSVGVAIGSGAQLLVACVFLWAALGKLTDLHGFGDTLARLGLPAATTRPAAAFVVVAETTTAAGLLIAPSAWWPKALVAVAALGFAGAGTWALTSRRTIACRCFGGNDDGVLGWRQVALLPAWVGLIWLALQWPPGWTSQSGVAILAVVPFVFIAVKLPGQLRRILPLRADRIAIAPAFGPGRGADVDPQTQEGEETPV